MSLHGCLLWFHWTLYGARKILQALQVASTVGVWARVLGGAVRRGLLVLLGILTGLVVGLVGGIVAWAGGSNPSVAILTGGAACGGTITVFVAVLTYLDGQS